MPQFYFISGLGHGGRLRGGEEGMDEAVKGTDMNILDAKVRKMGGTKILNTFI